MMTGRGPANRAGGRYSTPEIWKTVEALPANDLGFRQRFGIGTADFAPGPALRLAGGDVDGVDVVERSGTRVAERDFFSRRMPQEIVDHSDRQRRRCARFASDVRQPQLAAVALVDDDRDGLAVRRERESFDGLTFGRHHLPLTAADVAPDDVHGVAQEIRQRVEDLAVGREIRGDPLHRRAGAIAERRPLSRGDVDQPEIRLRVRDHLDGGDFRLVRRPGDRKPDPGALEQLTIGAGIRRIDHVNVVVLRVPAGRGIGHEATRGTRPDSRSSNDPLSAA